MVLQSNMIPERATIFEFCFEKKASGNWCDWMDTIDKSTLAISPTAKVCKLYIRGCKKIHLTVCIASI